MLRLAALAFLALIPELAFAQEPASGDTLSDAVLHACQGIDSTDVIRLVSSFGEFQGTVDVIGPAGLEGFHLTTSSLGGVPIRAPAGRLTWDQVRQLDRRGNSLWNGARVGALGGALMGLVVFMGSGGKGLAPADAVEFGLGFIGVFSGAAIGAGVGGLIGLCAPGWHAVYLKK